MLDLDQLDFTRGGGSVVVVAQDAVTEAVLMVAHADRAALERTLATGEMHYQSRRRGLWRKGETSGHVQRVVSLRADCDGDAVLARVTQCGPACHTGAPTCFGEGAEVLAMIDAVIAARAVAGPGESGEPPGYTRRLLDDRNLRLKKLGEETAELVAACALGEPEAAVREAADLLYHTLVAVRAAGGTWGQVKQTLEARRR
jgi:phosphoribosyl-ATP pyrophosphohydrolase/phosphoribosyl-AMP cyclohydrolase